MAKVEIQSLKGMRDLLPEQSYQWQFVEEKLRKVIESYGYQEIRTPLLEKTELFKRSMGEVTDVVEKEMYSFTDLNGDSISLRPEATASCVRAGMQHGKLQQQIQRWWYSGFMFRHEKPQKGRYRQFQQVGVEVFGLQGPDIDIELMLLSWQLWQALGLDNVILEVNSIGNLTERQNYKQDLVKYFEQYKSQLDVDSQRRLYTNPLRILDSKNPEMQTMIAKAPKMLDYLSKQCQQHFVEITTVLTQLKVPYRVNPYLVRGLDYYNQTVFEWLTPDLGSQGTICAGGRYDGLVTQLGGKAVPAIGFALGVDRLIDLIQATQIKFTPPALHAYWIAIGEQAQQQSWSLQQSIRQALPQLRLLNNCNGGNFKTQFKRADKSGALYAIVLAESELEQATVTIKPLRSDEQQQTIQQTELVNYFATIIRTKDNQ